MVCVLPIGSYEQHGPHLPPTVDAEVALYIASRLAERLGGRLLPPIYYTCSDEHRAFPQTISVRCRSFLPYLEDVLRSAVEKCGRVVAVVGHGGVWEAVSLTAQQLNYELGPSVLPINVWAYAAVRDHAGTDETSVYLAVGGRLTGDMPEICEGDVSLFGKMAVDRFSKTGVVGCLKPEEVSADRGREVLEKAVQKMVERVEWWLSRCTS